MTCPMSCPLRYISSFREPPLVVVRAYVNILIALTLTK
jgi:hypothetical protein